MKAFLARLCLGTFQALALLALCATSVSAQTVSQSIQLGWTAPTKNTDGSAISGTLTYTLFQGPSGGPFVQAATGVSGTSTVVTSISSGNCFSLAAVETVGVSVTTSALTPTVCALVPSPATGLQISVTITVK
jgi:hypothetical protein